MLNGIFAKKIRTIFRILVLTAVTYHIKSNVIPQIACICKVFARFRRAKSVCRRRPARENPAISMTLPMVSMTLGTISTTLGTIPRTLGAVATTIEMISTTMAAVPTTLGTAPTTLGTISMTMAAIPMTLGTVPTTKETSATVKETPSRVMEMTPSWQVMGGGKREFHRAKDAKAAKSQRDAMTIAQPFMAGSGVNQM